MGRVLAIVAAGLVVCIAALLLAVYLARDEDNIQADNLLSENFTKAVRLAEPNQQDVDLRALAPEHAYDPARFPEVPVGERVSLTRGALVDLSRRSSPPTEEIGPLTIAGSDRNAHQVSQLRQRGPIQARRRIPSWKGV